MGKRWKMVKSNTHANNHKQYIATKMLQFQFVIKEIIQQGLTSDQPYFNRDYKDEGSEPFLIHYFLTETFLLRIECTLNFDTVVEYSFENCPHEEAIRAIIKSTG
ncbi:hypothetical protein A0256_03355 [Mucilaginibacter sp. PAMC 26640]|nr:hypothetical protein A0256_03355 [Mucilaginibacter sp. PAMC 26640]